MNNRKPMTFKVDEIRNIKKMLDKTNEILYHNETQTLANSNDCMKYAINFYNKTKTN